MQEQLLKSSIEYIKEAWGIYTKKENFIFFARIMTVLVVATTTLNVTRDYLYPLDYLQNSRLSNIPMSIGFMIISFLLGIISLWSQTTQYFAVLKMGNPEKDVFKLGFKYAGEFLLASLAIGIIIMFGLALLIVPAIIFGVWYSFSLWLVLDKDLRLRDSLKQSKAMVKGKFWKVLGRLVVFLIPPFVASFSIALIPYIGKIIYSFITPLFLIPQYLLYKDMSANQSD